MQLLLSSTAEHLLTEHNLRNNGHLYLRGEGRQLASPFSCLGMHKIDKLFISQSDQWYRAEDGPSSFLRAMDANGCPCIVQLLNRNVPLDSSQQPGGAEAAAVLHVCDITAFCEAVSIVQAEVISLHLSADDRSMGHGPRNYAAIVMPQHCGSVAAQLQMSETRLRLAHLKLCSNTTTIARLQLKLEAKGCYVRLSTCTQRIWCTWM